MSIDLFRVYHSKIFFQNQSSQKEHPAHHFESTTTAEPSLVGITSSDDAATSITGGPSIDFSLPGSTARDGSTARSARTNNMNNILTTTSGSDGRSDPLNRSLESVDLDRKSIAYQRELLKRVHEERQTQNEKLLEEQQDKKARELQLKRQEEENRFAAEAL